VRRLLEVVVGPLLDSRARRALEETVLDWCHELQGARGLLARRLCDLRAIVALSRTTASIVLNEIAELPANAVGCGLACGSS
jgi:hypothetical protein